MNIKHLTLICLATLPLMALTCDRDKTETPAPAAGSKSLEEFTVKHRSPKQAFTVNAQSPIHIVGQQGIIVDIAANSITTHTGAPVTGNVQVELTEVFTKKDMILHNKPTTTWNQMLESQGEFLLTITQNSIKLNAPAKVVVPAKATSANPTQLFVNPSDNQTATDTTNMPNVWFELMDSTDSPIMADLTYNQNTWYYLIQMQVEGVYWTNCDVFYPSSSAGSSYLNGGTYSSPSNKAIRIYVSLNGYQSTGILTPFVGNTFGSSSYTLPNGIQGKIIAMQFDDGKFFFGKTPITTGPGITPHVNLTEITEAALVAELNTL